MILKFNSPVTCPGIFWGYHLYLKSLILVWRKGKHFDGGQKIFNLTLLFRHTLLIKGNSIFVNHIDIEYWMYWYWIKHYVFDLFISLIIMKVFFLLSRNFCTLPFHLFYTPFFPSVTRRKERERGDVKTVKNWGLKLKRVLSN